MSEVTLFVRKASGLVRSWSMFDAFIYATFSINLITLGLYIFSYCYYFDGNLATAVVVGGIFTVFEVIVYASLISAMPRAGGDYVWQSRILGRGIGFVLAVTGWWFILWLWVPLYADMLRFEVLTPLLAIAGAQDPTVFAPRHDGPGPVEPQPRFRLLHSAVFLVGSLVTIHALRFEDRPYLFFEVNLVSLRQGLDGNPAAGKRKGNRQREQFREGHDGKL